MAREIATLGGGCFWCLEAAFQGLTGVTSVISGYAGGQRPQPSYQQVCTGTTGHAEVVQVHFDPDRIAFATLLEVFFTIHDPTTPNQQGADIGTQYRSVIFYHSEAQQTIAEQTIARLNTQGLWPRPIVTQLVPSPTFYPAEDYHQDYYRRNAAQQYCRLVIDPKLAKLRQHHATLLRSD